MKHRKVEVTWIDAYDVKGEAAWMTLQQVKDLAESYNKPVVSIGFLIGKHAGQILLAGAYATPIGDDYQVTYSTVQAIPAGWVKKMRTLK